MFFCLDNTPMVQIKFLHLQLVVEDSQTFDLPCLASHRAHDITNTINLHVYHTFQLAFDIKNAVYINGEILYLKNNLNTQILCLHCFTHSSLSLSLLYIYKTHIKIPN